MYARRMCNRPKCRRVAFWLCISRQWDLCNECARALKIDLADLDLISPTDAGTGADTSGDEELGFPEPVTRFIPLVRKDAQADAIKAAVDKANNRAADAWLLRWKGKEPFASMTREDFEAWLRSGADAPKDGQ